MNLLRRSPPFSLLAAQNTGLKLLVSVQSLAEARTALAAGVDILDLKNPAMGPLGAVQPNLLPEVRELTRQLEFAGWVTAARGELAAVPDSAALTQTHCQAVDAFKYGLAGERARPDWRERWAAEMNALPAVIAVAYLDAKRAHAPEVEDVVALALASPAPGLLLDTCLKDELRWCDFVDDEDLRAWAARLRQAGKFLAVGGRATGVDVPRLAAAGVNVLAIRGAACVAEDRTSTIDAAATRALVAAVRATRRPPRIGD